LVAARIIGFYFLNYALEDNRHIFYPLSSIKNFWLSGWRF
jgi:hypothetical protein